MWGVILEPLSGSGAPHKTLAPNFKILKIFWRERHSRLLISQFHMSEEKKEVTVLDAAYRPRVISHNANEVYKIIIRWFYDKAWHTKLPKTQQCRNTIGDMLVAIAEMFVEELLDLGSDTASEKGTPSEADDDSELSDPSEDDLPDDDPPLKRQNAMGDIDSRGKQSKGN